MSHYLVTGGLGVIGSEFSKSKLRGGHTVTIIDAAEEQRNLWMADQLENEFGAKVSIRKERLEKSDLTGMLGSIDFIMHAAAHTGIPHSTQDPADDWSSNVDATRNLLEQLRRFERKIPCVALSSVKPYRTSDAVLTEQDTRYTAEDFTGISELVPLEPDEPYAASKMAQSALCMAYGRSYDLPVTVYRCSNLYGAAPCHGPRHGWLTWFCISAVLGRSIKLQGNGKQVRDMLFSDDVTSAVMAGFENIQKLKGNVYNIGGGSDNSISCFEATGLVDKYQSVSTDSAPGRVNEDLLFIVDHRKFTEATGWKPRVSVPEGVARIVKWAKQYKPVLEALYADAH